jgi:ABC-type uncharacterized transport system permease subunit
MALIITYSGVNPITAFSKMVTDIASSDIKSNVFIFQSSVLMITGVAIAISLYTGMFNIGVEGQFVLGGTTAIIAISCLNALTNSSAGQPIYFFFIFVGMFMGALVGYLWGLIIGVLRVKFNVNEVVSGIMMNYIGLALAALLIKINYGPGMYFKNPNVQDSTVTIDGLRDAMHVGIFNIPVIVTAVAILVLVAFWFVKKKTTVGFSMNIMGKNDQAGKYIGINTDKVRVNVLATSGMLAGLAGALFYMFDGSAKAGAFSNYGFDGIAAAALGGLTSSGIFLAALFLKFLSVGSESALRTLGIDPSISNIIIGIIILMTSSRYLLNNVINYFRGEEETSKKAKKVKKDEKIISEKEETRKVEIYGDTSSSDNESTIKITPDVLNKEEYKKDEKIIPEKLSETTEKSSIYRDVEKSEDK